MDMIKPSTKLFNPSIKLMRFLFHITLERLLFLLEDEMRSILGGYHNVIHEVRVRMSLFHTLQHKTDHLDVHTRKPTGLPDAVGILTAPLVGAGGRSDAYYRI